MSSKANWDAAADRKLLLGVLKTQNVTVDCKAMAKYMSADGQSYTESSIKNRMFKLKQMAKNGDPGEGGDTPTPKSSRKRSAAGSPYGETPTKKGKGAKGKGSKGAAAEADDEEAVKEEIKKEEGSEDELA